MKTNNNYHKNNRIKNLTGLFVYFFIFLFYFPAFAAQAISYVPPLNESDMLRYANFCRNKTAEFQKSAALKSSQLPINLRQLYSLTESRPYENMKPAVGTHNVVVLLVDFDDMPYSKVENKLRPAEYYKDMVFNPDTRSMNRYFKDVSEGLLNINGIVAKANPGEGADKYWYRSQKPYAEWGRDISAYDSVDSPNISELAAEIIKNSSLYFDYSKYDADADGIISPDELHIIIFHSGSGQEKSNNSNDIWSHRFNLVNTLRVNNVMVDSYIMLSCDSPVGVISHEFCHDLGLFDIYDTNTGDSVLGSFSIMDRGAWNGTAIAGYTPSYPCAYERILLGWIKPEKVANEHKKICFLPASMPSFSRLDSSEIYAKAVKFEVPGTAGKEFLVMENRYKTPRSFDDALPPSSKSENGVFVYHIDETMPDKTFYGYANDSRNSRYRVCMVKNGGGSVDNAYFTNEFYSGNSNLKNFYNGAENLFRMTLLMQPTGLINSEFNLGKSEITSFIAASAAGQITTEFKFSNVNKNMTKISISLRQDVANAALNFNYSSDEVKAASDDIWLLKNYNPQNLSEIRNFNIADYEIIDGDNYYLTIYLEDGICQKTYKTSYFGINSGAKRLLKADPLEINRGVLFLDVILAESVLKSGNTEGVYLQYTDYKGDFCEKMIADPPLMTTTYYNGIQKPARRYKYYVDDSVNSDIIIKVKTDGVFAPGLSKKIVLNRTAPQVTYGVYSSVLIPDSLLFILESNKKLHQAQFYVKEEGCDTKTVAISRRSGDDGEIYYGRYKISGASSGTIKYYAYCIDMAGNSYKSEGLNNAGGSEVYKLDFNYLRSPGLSNRASRYEFDGNAVEFINNSSLSGSQSAAVPLKSNSSNFNYAFLKIEKKSSNYKITFMPEDAGEISDIIGEAVEMKVSGSGITYLVNEKTGKECMKNTDGSFKITGFGVYSASNQAPALTSNTAFYPVPNPAKTMVSFHSAKYGLVPSKKFTVKIFDASNDKVYENDFYSGEKINLGSFANGTYFYSVKGEDGSDNINYKGKFSVLK